MARHPLPRRKIYRPRTGHSYACGAVCSVNRKRTTREGGQTLVEARRSSGRRSQVEVERVRAMVRAGV